MQCNEQQYLGVISSGEPASSATITQENVCCTLLQEDVQNDIELVMCDVCKIHSLDVGLLPCGESFVVVFQFVSLLSESHKVHRFHRI